MYRVCAPGHVPLHPSLWHHCLEEGEREKVSAREERLLILFDLEDPLVFSCEQLLVCICSPILKHEASFLNTAILLPSSAAVDRILLRVC